MKHQYSIPCEAYFPCHPVATGFLIVSASLLLGSVSVFAQSASWNGGLSSDWSTAQNWANNLPPQNANNSTVTINVSTFNTAVASGAALNGGNLNIGSLSGASGTLELTENSNFQFNLVNVGTQGTGNLSIIDSTLITTSTVNIGSVGRGVLKIVGPSASLKMISSSVSHLNIGNNANGYGRVEIRDGATIEARNVSLGNLRGSGDLIVNGLNSKLIINERDLSAAGRTGDVYIEVSDGGLIEINGDPTSPSNRGLLQLGSNSGTLTELLITGEGSRVATTGNGLIAEFGTVSARVEDEGSLDIGNHLLVGVGVGDLIIVGNSTVQAAGDTVIGIGLGRGSVTVSDNSKLSANGAIYIAQGVNAKGTLNIGAAADASIAVEAGFLDVTDINFGSGDGLLVFNHISDVQSGPYEFTQRLNGAGRIEHYSGLTRFSSMNNAGFTGTTHVFGGTMHVDGVLGGSITVEENGTLQGIGSVGSVTNHGVISPGGSIGTLTINGDYVGQGGLIWIETILADDTSLSDRLIITGETSGDSNVAVRNIGGTGAYTIEGIKIIEVGGGIKRNF